MSVMNLPMELVELIIHNITESADLLSLGLTCKLLADIILPRHLFYHTISGSIDHDQLWIYLAANPQMCRYIRRLEVSRFRNPRMRLSVDRGAGGWYHDYADSQLFIRALREMVHLKAFTLVSDTLPLMCEDSDIAREYSNLWYRHVPTCPDSIRCASAFEIPLIINQLRDLVCITLNVGQIDSSVGNSFVAFLRNCNKIECLKLVITEPNEIMEGLYATCRWPNLKVLLFYLPYKPSQTRDSKNIENFFTFHSKILSFQLCGDHLLRSINLPHNCLPNMKDLLGDTRAVRSVVTTPCIPPRPLEKIGCFPNDNKLWENPEVSFQGVDRHSLKSISFSCDSLTKLANLGRFFPNLEYVIIYANWKIWDADIQLQWRHITDAERANGVFLFQHVKILQGIPFFTRSQDEEETQSNISWVIETFPSIELCSNGHRTEPEIALIRDGNSTRLDFHHDHFEIFLDFENSEMRELQIL